MGLAVIIVSQKVMHMQVWWEKVTFRSSDWKSMIYCIYDIATLSHCSILNSRQTFNYISNYLNILNTLYMW